MLEEYLAAIAASANWCGVPVSSLTRDQYRAAYKAGVHQVSDSDLRQLGKYTTWITAAGAQEDFSTDNAAKVWTQAQQLRQLRKEKSMLADRVGQLQAGLEIIDHLDSVDQNNLVYRPVVSRNKRTAAAVAVLSDLHVEETVDPDAVEGCNAYDLPEAEKRLRRFFESVDWLIRHHRTSFQINTLVLGLIGDLISGYIHDELMESNSLSPTEAVCWLTDRLIPGIDMLLEKTKLEQIVIPCCFGNHGRTTKRTHIQTIHKNNLELFVYDSLRRHYATDERVDVVIAKGELLYVEVFDFVLRFTHGDAIKGSNRLVGPISSAATKIAAWDTTRPADRTIMGHWHRYTALPNMVINGSLIGFGPFAQHIGATFEEPAQAFFLMDSQRGATFDTPIWVRELTADEKAGG